LRNFFVPKKKMKKKLSKLYIRSKYSLYARGIIDASLYRGDNSGLDSGLAEEYLHCDLLCGM
jgi:hypothetical protein